METLGIFYDRSVHFRAVENILCPFGTFCIQLVHFVGFGIMHQEKSGNPGRQSKLKRKEVSQFKICFFFHLRFFGRGSGKRGDT
jgi:hypothetical protein